MKQNRSVDDGAVQDEQVLKHQQALQQCRLCPAMIPPVITGQAVMSKVMLIGQAPGDREGVIGKPFGWTAGKTLFQWFDSIGVGEDAFRRQVYIAAVCRCFPGKNPNGGDRVPDRQEIQNCSRWLKQELQLLKPELVIPVGKLAISQYLPVNKLVDVIGAKFEVQIEGIDVEMIPLPHPSGASTWHRMSPGKELLQQALDLLADHESWKRLQD